MTQQFHSAIEKMTELKRYIHPNAHSSIIYNCRDTETTQVSVNRWIDKEYVVYMYYGILLRNDISPFAATRMDLEGTMLNEISQAEKDKYCMITLFCGIEKYKKTNENNKKEADPQIQKTN